MDVGSLLELPDRAAWRAWLESNHDTPQGVWLQLDKKGPGARLRYEDALEEQTGSWYLLDAVEDLVIPEDLGAKAVPALGAHGKTSRNADPARA